MIKDWFQNSSSKTAVRYLVGSLGIYVVKAIFYKATGRSIDSTVRHIRGLADEIKKSKTEDEILNGKAGFLAAILALKYDLRCSIATIMFILGTKLILPYSTTTKLENLLQLWLNLEISMLAIMDLQFLFCMNGIGTNILELLMVYLEFCKF